MHVMLMDANDDFGCLAAIATEWAAEANRANCIGWPEVLPEAGIATLRNMVAAGSGDVLVLMKDDAVCGLMGLAYQPNHFGAGIVANECFWYVTPTARRGGLLLLDAAEKLADTRRCLGPVINAHRLAGDADRVNRLLGLRGYLPLETAHVRVR